MDPEPGGLERRDQDVAPLAVVRRAAARSRRPPSESGDRRGLERRRGADRQEVVDAPDPDRQIGRREHPADAPAGDGVGLRHRVDRDRPLAHPGQRRQRDVLSLEDEVLVDVVGEGDQVVLQAELRDEGQLLAREHLAGRVVRAVHRRCHASAA
jgi:hypothetical protein